MLYLLTHKTRFESKKANLTQQVEQVRVGFFLKISEFPQEKCWGTNKAVLKPVLEARHQVLVWFGYTQQQVYI